MEPIDGMDHLVEEVYFEHLDGSANVCGLADLWQMVLSPAKLKILHIHSKIEAVDYEDHWVNVTLGDQSTTLTIKASGEPILELGAALEAKVGEIGVFDIGRVENETLEESPLAIEALDAYFAYRIKGPE